MTVNLVPLLPWGWLTALSLAVVMLLGIVLWLRVRGWPWRAAALLLLLACLYNPVFTSQTREPLNDIAVIVVDESKSQAVGERTAQTAAALAAVKQRITALKNMDVRVVPVQSGTTLATDGTRLFTALNRAMGDIPPERFAGAIMITDGQVHDVPENLKAPLLPGPLHVLLTGSKHEIDRRIVIDQAPRFALVGQQQTLAFHVDETGGTKAPVTVTVQLGTTSLPGLTVQPGEKVELPLTLPHAGENVLQLSVPALPGEISQANNRAVAVIEGIRDRMRVLLVSGQPYAGERTLRNLLKADATVDLVHFTILRPPERFDPTPPDELALIAFPTRELFVERVKDFDLVIFDRYHRESVLPDAYIQFISAYVRDGGALLVSSGPEFAESDGLYSSPMAEVLAASPTGDVLQGAFRATPSKIGQRHPVTSELPGAAQQPVQWGQWLRMVETNASPQQTLLTGLNDKPLLVLSHQGKGRSAQLLSDQSWLWGRGFDGGGPQIELLRRLAHWLMKEPDLEEEALRGTQSGTLLSIERRTLADSANPVKVTSPDGKSQMLALKEITPGRWQAETPVTEAGLYSLDDGKLQAVAAATDADAREARDLMATADKLTPVTQATAGGIAWLEDGLPQLLKITKQSAMAGAGWLGLQDNHQYRLLTIQALPPQVFLGLLALLLLILGTMWYREGH